MSCQAILKINANCDHACPAPEQTTPSVISHTTTGKEYKYGSVDTKDDISMDAGDV